MKNGLRIDFKAKMIIMSRAFAEACTNPYSDEYAKLQAVRRDFPDFKVERKSIKKCPHKKTYKGLTYEYMERYIVTHEEPKEAKAVLSELSEMRLIAECHSQGYKYPVIKKWFLNKYPEVANFGLESTASDEEEMVIGFEPLASAA